MTAGELKTFLEEKVKAYGAFNPADDELEGKKFLRTPEAYEGKVVALLGQFDGSHTGLELFHRGSLLFFRGALEFHARGLDPKSEVLRLKQRHLILSTEWDQFFLVGAWERARKAAPSLNHTSWGINTYLICGMLIAEAAQKAEIQCETLKPESAQVRGEGRNTRAGSSEQSVVSVSDPTFQSCKPRREPALEPILANKNLCILVGKQATNLKGHVYVYLIGPSTIDERNSWMNEVGEWLKTQAVDACAQETIYLTDPDSVKPPLAKQVAGIPGEKAFLRLGGLDKPSFCPQPCNWDSYRLDRRGRCSDAAIAEQGQPAQLPKIEKAAPSDLVPPVSQDDIDRAWNCAMSAGLERLKTFGPEGEDLYHAIQATLSGRNLAKNRANLQEAFVKFGIDIAPYGACFEPIFFPPAAGGGARPATPTNLTVSPDPTNGTVMQLTWQDNSYDEWSFEISNGNESRSAPGGTGTVEYTWTGLKPGSWTCFRVRASNGDTYSNWEPNASPKCAYSSRQGMAR
jgi:hypothetical protein